MRVASASVATSLFFLSFFFFLSFIHSFIHLFIHSFILSFLGLINNTKTIINVLKEYHLWNTSANYNIHWCMLVFVNTTT